MFQIIILIGNICSGKTTIAKLLEPKGFRFFPVEDVKKELNFKNKEYDKNQDILYREYVSKIIEFGKNEKLIIESTGGNKFWPSSYQEIKKYFGSKAITILVKTNQEICLSRLNLNKKGHRFNTREELIPKINAKLSSDISYDYIITNNSSVEEFIQSVKKILSKINI